MFNKKELLNTYKELQKKWQKDKIEKGGILLPLIDEIKRNTDTKSLTMIIDRFDWISNSNKKFQTSFKYYLEMFDKYIVTSDDLYVRNGFNKREKLKENNFDIIDVNYGTNYKLARDIITKDLNYWKNKKQIIKHVPILKDLKEIISKEGYEKLITECNGDFEMIFESIKPIYYNYDYISNRDELEKNIFEFQKNKFKERMEYETKYKVKTLHL